MTNRVFRRIQQLEAEAAKVKTMNSPPHTLLWVGMDRQPTGGIRWDRDQKRYVDVDVSTLRWDTDKKRWTDD
jgi:hypothetical protein